MAKRFDIHEWQAKQRLAEQEEFTPDLEDDDLKRAKIQQMMNTEKGLQKDDYKLVNSISNVADMYSYGEILDALESFYIKNDEQPFAEMARKHAKEFRDFLDSEDELNEVNIKRVVDQSMSNDDIGKLMSVIRNNDLGKTLNTIAVIVDQTRGMPEGAAQMIADLVAEIPEEDEEEIDEQNVTGTGASFTAGSGEGYMSPRAFGDNKRKKRKAYMGYKEVNEQEEPEAETQEPEEEYSKDVEMLERLIDDKINTKDEWIDMFQILMAHSEEIKNLNSSQIKSLLQQSLKEI